MFENVGTVKEFKDGEVIFRENVPGKDMYVIEAGKVKLTRTNMRESKDIVTTLAVLNKGDFFGEMALFSGGARSATATAVGDAELKVISRRDLEEQVKQDPQTALHFLDKISRRMRRTDELIELLLVREKLAEGLYSKVDAVRYPEFL